MEIDSRATELGYEWFGTERDDARVFTADGRVFIENTSNLYDLIITDTYSNQIYIPFHITTLEYFTAIRTHLNSAGILRNLKAAIYFQIRKQHRYRDHRRLNRMYWN